MFYGNFLSVYLASVMSICTIAVAHTWLHTALSDQFHTVDFFSHGSVQCQRLDITNVDISGTQLWL